MNSLLVNSNLKYSKLSINGSKSESNRLLILKSLYKNLSIINISDCDDTNFLEKALKESSSLINIGHAGTAMRFLTSFFSINLSISIKPNESLLARFFPIVVLPTPIIPVNTRFFFNYFTNFKFDLSQICLIFRV